MNTTPQRSRPKPPAWAASDIEHIKLSKLAPNEHNSRRHPEDQIIQIADSIMAFGWTMPILVDEASIIIAGEGRWRAAQLLIERGDMQSDIVPCLRATGWTEGQKRAYIIADNQLTIRGEWDMEQLGRELQALDDLGVDLDLTGFIGDDLADILGGPGTGEGGGEGTGEEARKTLAERFGFVPFTVLNAREGLWQNRKAAWLGLGIESELGRGECVTYTESGEAADPDHYRKKKRPTARPGGSRQPAVDPETGKIVRADSKGRPIKGARTDAEADKMVVRGKGWGDGGPARRDPAFYAKKRAKEAELGRELTTEEFREQHWDPDAPPPGKKKRRKAKGASGAPAGSSRSMRQDILGGEARVKSGKAG